MNSYYKNLVVWQKAMDLTIEIYNLSKLLPKSETYALANQMQRSAVSIPSNIAEGQQRKSQKEFAQFISIAKGSCAELVTQTEICLRLNYFSHEQALQALTYLMKSVKCYPYCSKN